MAVIKYDASGSKGEENKGRQLKIPKRGVYTVKILECKVTKPEGKDRRIEVVAAINGGELKGSRYWEYINLESEAAAWKLDQWLQALGVAGDSTKRKGQLDTAKQINKLVKVSTSVENDANGDPSRSRIAAWLELAADDEDEDDDGSEDDADEDESEEDEEESEDEAEDEEEEEASDDGYDEASVADLRAELKDRGLDTKGGKTALVERLRENDGEADEEAEPEDDYDEWSIADLRSEVKDREISAKGGKSVLVAALRKDDAEGGALDS